ncbi:hypothetical protein [Micromonospora auratinigra]|uniref:Uncharacterized protein n=1 Tax=Micromonospora auratinigra TaxID=261654 RepID=A0A1A8ZWR1_9ACTN|nr:hypothetical protein [Micromonospora auratinigra]SBT48571.1 hypothetical protein GA0070611_4107 [Micromonospora auratinigra]
MSSEDERTDDAAANRPPVGELPGQLSFDRLDGGAAEPTGERADTVEPVAEEPPRPVAEPVRIPPPYDRVDKRRNQRRLPR